MRIRNIALAAATVLAFASSAHALSSSTSSHSSTMHASTMKVRVSRTLSTHEAKPPHPIVTPASMIPNATSGTTASSTVGTTPPAPPTPSVSSQSYGSLDTNMVAIIPATPPETEVNPQYRSPTVYNGAGSCNATSGANCGVNPPQR